MPSSSGDWSMWGLAYPENVNDVECPDCFIYFDKRSQALKYAKEHGLVILNNKSLFRRIFDYFRSLMEI